MAAVVMVCELNSCSRREITIQSINQSVSAFLREKLNMNQLKPKFIFSAYLNVLQALVGVVINVEVHLKVQLVAVLEKSLILSSLHDDIK